MNSITPIQQRHSGKPGFPLRLFAAAFVISLLTGVFGGWQAWQMHNRFQELSDKQAHVTEDIGRLMLFDEVLTMSARMAAATGESAYEKRYDQFDAQLTAVINHVRADLPQLEIEPFIRETDEANRALVEMERQAFALMHQGRRQEAMALLTGDEYLRLKKVYAGGMEKAADAMLLVLKREQRHLHSLTDLAAAANAMGILVLLAAWFFAARSARRWAAERREAEEALRKSHDELEDRVEQRTAEIQRLSQLFNLLSQCNQAVVRSANEDELFRHICRDAVQLGGFKMAWIGLVDEANKQVKPVASYGEGVEYLEGIQISVDADSPFGRGPTGTSIRENQPFWSQDFLNDPITVPWHESGTRFGWSSSASLPLHRDGVAIGAFMLYSGKANAFDEAVRKLLFEMARDISFALDHFAVEAERKQAEEKLRLHGEIERNMAEAVYLIRISDGVIVYTNPIFEHMFGYEPGEMVGKHVSIVNAPGDKSSEAVANEVISSLMQTGVWNGEIHNIRKDGTTFWCHANVFTFEHPQYGRVWLSMHQDITERKRVEEKLRETRDYLENLFNHANAPIIVWNPSYQITMFNHAFERLTGRDANEVIGKQIDILFPADRKDEALAHIHQTKMGERWETIEIPILHSSGAVRTALWNSATLYSADGKNIVATMAQGQDITERKQAEFQLAEQVGELRRWHEATLGREMRTLELKHEVNELLGQVGQPPRYPSAESVE